MVVRKAWLSGTGTYSVDMTNDVYNPTVGTVRFSPVQPAQLKDGDEKHEKRDSDILLSPITPAAEVKDKTSLQQYLNIASLANLATLKQSDDSSANPGEWKAAGAPTEIAIEVFASRFGWNRVALSEGPNAIWKQMAEFPFDSDVKKMSVIAQHLPTGEMHLFTKVITP